MSLLVPRPREPLLQQGHIPFPLSKCITSRMHGSILPECMGTMDMLSAHRSHNSESDPLEVNLWMTMSHHVDAGTL